MNPPVVRPRTFRAIVEHTLFSPLRSDLFGLNSHTMISCDTICTHGAILPFQTGCCFEDNRPKNGSFTKGSLRKEELVALRGCLKSSGRCQPIQHQSNGGDVDHRLRGLHRVFVVFAHSTVAPEPGKTPFHNPREASDLERSLSSLHNVKLPAAVPQQLTSKLPAFVTGIGDDGVNPRE
jgi:hypothetical protein